LLEKRFGVSTRRFASIVFMVTRAFADSVRVFATAIPIALIIGPALPQRLVMPVAILVLGALTLLYTYHGGMRAVVWTDVLQTSVYLLGGLSAVYLLGKGVSGGWSSILSQAHDAGKLKVIDVYFGFDKPYTLFAGLIGGAFLSMASHGADQLIVQRLLAANNLKESRKALIGSGVAVFFQFACFGYGTPATSDYAHWLDGYPAANSTEDLVSALPKKLIAHPHGPIAYIGHVDTAFLHGFTDEKNPYLDDRWHHRIAPFKGAIDGLLAKIEPSGLAMETMSERFAATSALLANMYDGIKRKQPFTEDKQRRLLDHWIMRGDAQNFMVMGDPAALLRIPSP
jgi:hypothetical protein